MSRRAVKFLSVVRGTWLVLLLFPLITLGAGKAVAQDGEAALKLLPADCQAKAARPMDPGSIGVILLHGKRGTPGGHIKDLAVHLEDQGFKVATPEMPWSQKRIFDRSFEEAMNEIDRDIERLRGAGAKKIVVGGHSQGGTAVLGYGASRSGLAGVVVMAGGGDPGKIYGAKQEIRDSVEEAREWAASGRGGDQGSFTDLSLGRIKTVRTTARIYLSYFDPEGPALMPRNAAGLKDGAPLLWIFGRDDKLKNVNNPDYAFAKAPKNPLNAYVMIDAGHRNTPGKGRGVVAQWLKCLGR